MAADLSDFSTRKPSVARRRSSGAFTLIEVLVVVAIIVVLVAITVSVGSSVKTNASIRSTHATLKTLSGVMSDYLAQGNPEPDNPLASGYSANADMSTTSPVSDATRWVKALRADPGYSKKLSNLATGTMTDPDDPTKTTTTIVDSFGTPIRYVPYDTGTKKEGYFQSAGPDRVFDTKSPAPTPPLPADDLYSYDP